MSIIESRNLEVKNGDHVSSLNTIEGFKNLEIAKVERIATLIQEAGMVPTSLDDKDRKTRHAKICVAILYGLHVGLNPFQALTSVVVVNGQPTLRAEALLALCFRSGLLENVEEKVEDGVATVTVKRKGYPPVTRTFSIEDAKKAGLIDKLNWKQYPQRMLLQRARAFALRDAFPDISKGLYVTEELIVTPEDLEIDAVDVEQIQSKQQDAEDESIKIETKEQAWEIVSRNKILAKLLTSASIGPKSLNAAKSALKTVNCTPLERKAAEFWCEQKLAEMEVSNS